MLIGVISDTHDRVMTADSALQYFKARGVGLVVHAGDWKLPSTVAHIAQQARKLSLPVQGVLGNNDTDITALYASAEDSTGKFMLMEDVLHLHIQGKHITVYHGHHKPTLRKVLLDNSSDIIILGHSHKPKIETQNSQLIVNPGSTAFSIPRSTLWLPSVAMINTATMSAEIIYLDKP